MTIVLTGALLPFLQMQQFLQIAILINLIKKSISLSGSLVSQVYSIGMYCTQLQLETFGSALMPQRCFIL